MRRRRLYKGLPELPPNLVSDIPIEKRKAMLAFIRAHPVCQCGKEAVYADETPGGWIPLCERCAT